MKTFQIVTLFALIAAAMAFAPNAPKGEWWLLLTESLDPTQNRWKVFL